MLVQHKGDFELGADAVGAGNQYRMLNAGQVQRHHTAETADLIDTGRGLGSGDMGFHQFNRLVTGGNVDAGGFIAFAVAFHQIYSFRYSIRKILTSLPKQGNTLL